MKPQFITDEAGNRTGVILSISDYDRLIDELDENDTVRMYDEAKKEKLVFQPFNDVLKAIQSKRNKHLVSDSD